MPGSLGPRKRPATPHEMAGDLRVHGDPLLGTEVPQHAIAEGIVEDSCAPVLHGDEAGLAESVDRGREHPDVLREQRGQLGGIRRAPQACEGDRQAAGRSDEAEHLAGDLVGRGRFRSHGGLTRQVQEPANVQQGVPPRAMEELRLEAAGPVA